MFPMPSAPEIKPVEDYTIFVSVAAFNDRWLQQTIDTAISKAANPKRIFFGVWEHRTDYNFVLDGAGNQNIKHARLNYPHILGVGFARLNALAMYSGQDFFLQVDAHMIFNDDWDNILIKRYLEVAADTNNKKIIFSSFVPWWKPQKDGSKFFSYKSPMLDCIDTIRWDVPRPVKEIPYNELKPILENDNSNGLYIYEQSFQRDTKYVAIVKFWKEIQQSMFDSKAEALNWAREKNIEEWESVPQHQVFSVPLTETDGKPYAEHTIVTAHFIFTIARFIKDVMPDPDIMFMGEEHTTALRAWTRGYRIYGIQDVVLWHLNKDGIDDPQDRINYVPNDSSYSMHYQTKNSFAIKRTRAILTGELLGYWGSPNQELLQAFEEASNFNFKDFYTRVDKNEKK